MTQTTSQPPAENPREPQEVGSLDQARWWLAALAMSAMLACALAWSLAVLR